MNPFTITESSLFGGDMFIELITYLPIVLQWNRLIFLPVTLHCSNYSFKKLNFNGLRLTFFALADKECIHSVVKVYLTLYYGIYGCCDHPGAILKHSVCRNALPFLNLTQTKMCSLLQESTKCCSYSKDHWKQVFLSTPCSNFRSKMSGFRIFCLSPKPLYVFHKKL